MSQFILIMALLLIGYLLLLVEIFLIPGFALPGILGLCCIGLGSYIVWSSFGAAIGGITLIGSVVLMAITIIALFRSPFGRRLKLESVLSKEKGFTAAIESYQALLGKRGQAVTPLRPAGTMEIGTDRYDVVTEGDFIDVGESVEVVEIEGNRIVVQKSRT